MERNAKHLLLRKTDFSKLVGKVNFSENFFLRNAIALNSKKVQGIFGETFILASLSSVVFHLQNRVSAFFQFAFAQEIKDFHQSSLGDEVDFREIINVSPNILAKN